MKQDLRVGHLARVTGKTVRALHLYEELGLLAPGDRSEAGYRLYGEDAVVRVRWISKLQDIGFSLNDIRDCAQKWGTSASATAAMDDMRTLYERKLEETRSQIARLQSLQHELEASLKYLDTCETCDPKREVAHCTHCDLHTCDETAPDLVAGFHAHGHAQ